MSKPLQFRGSFGGPAQPSPSAEVSPSALRFPQTTATADQIVPISSIKVGNRTRKFFDPAKLEILKDSIKELGLLSPIGVTPDLELVYGGRRLQACHELGFEGIPVRVIHELDELAKLKAEHDENECREPFTAAEKYELVNRLYELFAPEAKERQLHSRFGARRTENDTTPAQPDSPPTGKTQSTAEKVAEAVGLSPATVHNIRVIKNSGNESIETAVLAGAVSVTAAAAQIKKEKKLPATKAVTVKKSCNHKVSTPDGQIKFKGAFEVSSSRISREKLDAFLDEILEAIQIKVNSAP